MRNQSDYARQVETATKCPPRGTEMFLRVYDKKLRNGDVTSLAHQREQSIQWVSRLTTFGGKPCPAATFYKWFCDLYAVNAPAADAIYETLEALVAQVRSEQPGPWSASATAASLVRQAAETVAALIETQCVADDLPALLDLKALVETAIVRTGTAG